MKFDRILEKIERGRVLIVHASFRPCAEAGLTPEEVIDALLERLGPEGTLVMPTFTYCYVNHPRHAAYDPAATPGVLNGVLSETFRRLPGVRRSGNPTYSVAVKGKYGELLTSGSDDRAGLGADSSYGNALKLGAAILLLNVGNNRNSMLHTAECLSGVPYNDIPFRESWGRTARTAAGEMTLKPEFPACSEAFGKFDLPFVEEGIALAVEGSFLIDAPRMVTHILAEIGKTPDIMLCRDPACEPCRRRRARLKERGLIRC